MQIFIYIRQKSARSKNLGDQKFENLKLLNNDHSSKLQTIERKNVILK